MKTAPIKALVLEVLACLPKPYTEHVIDDVFAAIEQREDWLKEYNALQSSTFTKTVLNNWAGYWVANALGKVGERVVISRRKNSLNGSYSILDTDAKTVVRRPKEDEARELMAAYYQAHKHELPPEIRSHREEIVSLIVEGHSPADAYALALKLAE
jgi:hypothetical protein